MICYHLDNNDILLFNKKEVAPIYKMFSRLYKDERGQGLMEYGLIVAIVSVAVILVLTNIGETNNNTLNTVAEQMVS